MVRKLETLAVAVSLMISSISSPALASHVPYDCQRDASGVADTVHSMEDAEKKGVELLVRVRYPKNAIYTQKDYFVCMEKEVKARYKYEFIKISEDDQNWYYTLRKIQLTTT